MKAHHLCRRAVFAALVIVAIASSARAAPLPEPGERLVGLARVWAKAKFFHPYLAYKDIDWDAALVAAIPKVEAATTVAEYRAAVQGMLAVQHDPVTRVMPAPAASAAAASSSAPGAPSGESWLSTVAPGIVKVRLAGFVAGDFDYAAIQRKAEQVQAEAAKASVLIVDPRVPTWKLVRPTLAGLRAGKDEVLDRALAYLASGK